MAAYTFKASIREVAQAHLRDAFLITQRPLTDAVIVIFKKTFGASDWASKLRMYLGQSMKDHVIDDGQPFDICLLIEALQKSISDVVQPALGLDHPELDDNLQRLVALLKTVFISRQWYSHGMSILVQECQFAIVSLVELCNLMHQLLADAALPVDFSAGIEGLKECSAAMDGLEADVTQHGAAPFSFRFDQIAAILVLRSFERLCAEAEDKSNTLFTNHTLYITHGGTPSDHYNQVMGCMSYSDVIDVIGDMKKPWAKMSSAVTVFCSFVATGRKILFHGTQRNTTLALLFAAGAVINALWSLGANAKAAAAATADELLSVLSHLQLCDKKFLLAHIARSQIEPPPPSPASDLTWLRNFLSAPVDPKFHPLMSEFDASKVHDVLKKEFLHVKKGSNLALPADDTSENKVKRCNMVLAAAALASVSLHCETESLGCVAADVCADSSLVSGKRSAEQRDGFFTGRVGELQRVCDAIEAVIVNVRPASAAANVAVLGVPGMGKSMLVSQALLKMQKEHAEKQREVYFLKLRGRGAASVEDDVLVAARSLGSKIAVAAGTPQSEALRLFKDYLSRLRFVAIIDDANVDGLQAAARLIPVSSALHAVLVTSQQDEEELMTIETTLGHFDKVALSGFDENTSLELIRKRCPSLCSDLQRLKDVARRLDLPLGVRLFCEWSQARYHRDMKPMNSARKAFMTAAKSAAKECGAAFDESSALEKFFEVYLAQPGTCGESVIVQQIIDDWTSNADVSDAELMQSNEHYPRGLLGTVRLALLELDRLDEKDAEGSRQLLSILALCPPINTPWSLFLGHDGQCISGLEHVTHCEQLERIARLLQRSGLVQVKGERFSMHQLLQRAVRREVAGGADAAALLIDGRVGGEDLNASNVYREMLPAVYHVVKVILSKEAARIKWCKDVRNRVADLLHWLGGGAFEVEIRRDVIAEQKADDKDPKYVVSSLGLAEALVEVGGYAEALVMYQPALVFFQENILTATNVIAEVMAGMAVCHSYLGRNAEALDMFEQALALRRRDFPDDLPNIARIMLSAAICYKELDRPAEALDFREKALASLTSALPADDLRIADALLNTASSYAGLGRHTEALDLCERALAIRQRKLPADHPDVAKAMIETATSYADLGRYVEALDLREQTLACLRRISPANDYNNTASLKSSKVMFTTANNYSELGRHAEALDLYEQVFAILQHELPADHPEIAMVMMGISISFCALGRHIEALDMSEQALVFLQRNLPADDPKIPWAMQTIAKTYEALGRYAEALDFRVQALSIRRRVLPAEQTTNSMFHTASIYEKLGRHAEALDLYEQVLAFQQHELPADHPDIAHAMMRTANSYHALGRHADAFHMNEQALAIQLRRGNLRDIAASKFNTASGYRARGRHAEALELREQALVCMQNILPADHIDIATFMIGVANCYSDLGRRTDALDLYRRGLAIRQRKLPADHPDVADAMHNTAICYCELGRHAEACDMFEQTLAIRRRRIPADDIEIADAMFKTANCYRHLGRHAVALDLYEQVLAIQQRKLPTDHHKIADSLFNICVSLDRSGVFPQCGFFAHETFAIQRSKFTDSHPDVQNALKLIHMMITHHGAAAAQPIPPPTSPHLRIGRLVRLHGLSAHALNGRQALVFGPEQNGRVAVRLVEASAEVRASLGWGRGVEKAIKVENLQAFDAEGLHPPRQHSDEESA